MTNALNSKVVVITGASAGVGRATVRAFAKRGAKIGLIARGEDGLRAAKNEVEKLGSKAVICIADVSRSDEVENAAQKIEVELGPIDFWINNAMVSVFSPVKDMNADDYRRVTEVTYLGYVHGTLSALKRMIPRNRGVIIQVGSALAYRAIPLQSAYCAAKHAVKGFTESLRTELLHDNSGIEVCQVHMPALNTPQFDWSKNNLSHRPMPIGKIFQPEVAAEAIVCAAISPRREMWVGYPAVRAIAGERIVPAYADRYLAKNGFDGQQSSQLDDPKRQNNLWFPLPGDHGSHGRFDADALSFSFQLWLSKNRKWIAALSVVAASLLFRSSERIKETENTAVN